MKRLLAAVALVAAVLMASCAPRTPPPQWQWSSESGKHCFYDCEASRGQCKANCMQARGGYILICASFCDEARESCMHGCPDVALRQASAIGESP